MGWFDTDRPSSRPHHSSRHSSYSGNGGSYYSSRGRAAPRSGYINRIIRKIKQLIRDIYYYARRHPVKVFMLVIMPLLTGGALHKIMAQFGIRLPQGMFGGMGGGRGGGYSEYERFSGRSSGGGLGDLAGGGGLQGIMGLAKMFM